MTGGQNYSRAGAKSGTLDAFCLYNNTTGTLAVMNSNSIRGQKGTLSCTPKGIRLALQQQPHIGAIRAGLSEAAAREAALRAKLSSKK